MKKRTLTLLLISGFLTTSSLLSETALFTAPGNIQPEIQNIKNKENIGHIIFKVGSGTSPYINKSVIPAIGVGYQSKLTNSSIFHSTMVEFSGSGKYKSVTKNEVSTYESGYMYFFPKIMGIHYWNKDSENRFFSAIGSNLCSYNYEQRVYDPKGFGETLYTNYSQTSIGLSMSYGYEMGSPDQAINTVKIEYDQPLLIAFTDHDSSFLGSLIISYSVGF